MWGSWARIYGRFLNLVFIVGHLFFTNQRKLRWLNKMLWGGRSCADPRNQETPLTPALQHGNVGTSAREIGWVTGTFIHFVRVMDKMPGHANMLKHTLISKLFTCCDIPTYHNEYWILLSCGGVTQEKNLISDKWSDYSERCNDSGRVEIPLLPWYSK